MEQFSLILRFVVLGLIYIVLFKIIKVMYIDVKGTKPKRKKKPKLNYALEVEDSPENIGINKGSVFPIHSAITIGRKDTNTISIDDPFVSGYHAKIILKDGKVYLKDLESTNGTRRNGDPVKGFQEVYIGDFIEIGRVIFKVIG
ncbi:FHA domain-containing protein [Clostridium cylindrosporum]|uniref:FHA-domain containing secreted protein n=1 Tax=Clostridium cylindrosporum DSM 605 TaxID=1121307 RepID=A0A0J8FZV1_CLOCY|nr:FHA domain-containing protein [Clostridium cylindrosporum]KMT21081.1 FHA-domain containing secreted protein [Clostridium cylindrosporum DSM 605]